MNLFKITLLGTLSACSVAPRSKSGPAPAPVVPVGSEEQGYYKVDVIAGNGERAVGCAKVTATRFQYCYFTSRATDENWKGDLSITSPTARKIVWNGGASLGCTGRIDSYTTGTNPEGLATITLATTCAVTSAGSTLTKTDSVCYSASQNCSFD